MSAAAAAPVNNGAAVPAKKGKKKLIVIVLALLLVLVIAGGAAVFLLKKKAAAAEEAGDEAPTSAKVEGHGGKPDLKHPPTFLPLDPFIVNLADKDTDRYAQVGITFEVEDPKFAEQMKAFMPAIRNGILLILAHKSSGELLDRSGKERLAAEILREAARTMGIEVEAPEPVAMKKSAVQKIGSEQAAGDDEEPKREKKKRAKAPVEPNPIKHVHFSNFIVQ